MRYIRWFVESVIDLIHPPQEGDPEIKFGVKLAAFLFLVLAITLLIWI